MCLASVTAGLSSSVVVLRRQHSQIHFELCAEGLLNWCFLGSEGRFLLHEIN